MSSEPEANSHAPTGRREFNRRKFAGMLEIEWGSSTLTVAIRDIGPQGLFVELTPSLWVGATFLARLAVDPPIKLNCTVRRVEPGKGFAVAFDLLEESSKAQLERLLATLPKI